MGWDWHVLSLRLDAHLNSWSTKRCALVSLNIQTLCFIITIVHNRSLDIN